MFTRINLPPRWPYLQSMLSIVMIVASLSYTLFTAQVAQALPSSQYIEEQAADTSLNTAANQPLSLESVGPDDLIEIMVAFCPELSRPFRITSDGLLLLPLVHKPLLVTGLTPIQLTRLIESSLIEERILNQPTVSVMVTEYRSRPVSVVGAVNHPLTFQATSRTTLLDAIAKAGGLGPSAGGSVIITSLSNSTSSVQASQTIQVIAIDGLISGSDPSLNMKINGNEEIRVPEANKIFIAGNVRHPGMYSMQGNTDTTIVKAIALSQGLEPYSSATAFIYRRQLNKFDRDEIEVPLKKILSHKSADLSLLPDDILYIPASDGKRITSRVLSQLAGFGQAAGTGLIIYK